MSTADYDGRYMVGQPEGVVADEELANYEQWAGVYARGFTGAEQRYAEAVPRLIAALRATREALADTQRDLVDARHDLDQARMDAAKRLVDYRASREEAERQRVQLLRHHATKDVEQWGRPCAVCDPVAVEPVQ